MQTTRCWVQFDIGGERYALPVEAVAQVVGLDCLQPAGQAGWAGLAPLQDGILPLAEGADLLGSGAEPARGRGLVLRGRLPLGFTVDQVVGVTVGTACPLVGRVGLPSLAEAALPTADGTSVVLSADRLWRRLRAGLEQQPGGKGFRLRPLARRTPDRAGARGAAQAARVDAPAPPPAAPVAPPAVSADTFPGGRVLVFRAGLEADLAVPIEQVLEVGPARAVRPLRGGPPHLAGLLEWRGRLVPLVDLPSRLGSAVEPPRQTLYLALSGRAAQALAVGVGEVAGPAMAPAVRPAPRDFGVPASWVRGVARLGERPLLVLDPAALVGA